MFEIYRRTVVKVIRADSVENRSRTEKYPKEEKIVQNKQYNESQEREQRRANIFTK